MPVSISRRPWRPHRKPSARAQREALGQTRWPRFREEVETEVAAARAALGKDAWVVAFAAGHALSAEEAIAEALAKI